MNLNLREIPFSKDGSYLKIFIRADENYAQISTAGSLEGKERSGIAWNHDFYQIKMLKEGIELPYEYDYTPTELVLYNRDSSVKISFMDNFTFIFNVENAEVKLVPFRHIANKIDQPGGVISLTDYAGMVTHQFNAGENCKFDCNCGETIYHESAMFADKSYVFDFFGEGTFTFALRFSDSENIWYEPLPSYESVSENRKKEYNSWMEKTPKVEERYIPAARRAWEIIWQCIVDPRENLTGRTIYMSKNWMNKVWAWDNCFNALAVCGADEDLAWDQLYVFFDKQKGNGMLPDSITDLRSIYGFVKPPIYGWTIMKLLNKTNKENILKHVRRCYEPVTRLTEWWYKARDYDGDGMCQYHHGNDSGWDNATMFDQGYPTEGSDLAGHLVLQTHALSKMAELLGLAGDADMWKERSKTQLENLLNLGVKNGRFFSPRDGKSDAPECSSLLNYIAVVIGKRIPADILKNITNDIRSRYLTEYGLATEAVDSPKYESDGYWRGPIWAPSTYLIFDGLLDAGEVELAREIAVKFCDMCVKEPGMYENYDALTGKGLRCPGYSWTASVFLLLAEWLRNN